MSKAWRGMLAGILVSVLGLTAEAAKFKVLCVSDTPETNESNYYQNAASFVYQMHYFLSPKDILADDFAVEQIGWLGADKMLAQADKYDAVIIWDAPCYIKDSRGYEAWYSDLTVVSDDTARKLVQYVKAGGALVLAGGSASYGNGHEMLGSTNTKQKYLRKYFGFAQSPLAQALPVEIPDAPTLQPFAEKSKRHMFFKAVQSDPIILGLDYNHWGVDAYHQVKAKQGAAVPLVASNGDPLLARWQFGQGRVICVLAAPICNNFVAGSVDKLSNPLWPNEAILWDRVLRWCLGVEYNEAAEDAAVAKYRRIIANPPAVPLQVTLQEYPFVAHALDIAIPGNLQDLAMKYFNVLKFNQLVMQGTSLRGAIRDFFKSYAQSLANNSLVAYLHPDLCAEAAAQKLPPEQWAQVALPSGKYPMWYGTPWPDPFSAVTIGSAVKTVDSYMPQVKDFPRILGAFYDDEWAWVMGYINPYQPGGQALGNYSPSAKEYYKKLTGQDAPAPVYHAPGYVAPEDDPFLKWCQVIRQDGYKYYNEKVRAAHKKYRPDFVLSNYPGGFEGNLSLMIEEVYLDCWKESELETIERMDVRPNFREDTLRTKYPTWALIGIFRMPEDKSMYPESMRLTVGLCLGSGAKGVILWNSVNLWAPFLQIVGRDPLDAEAVRLGQYLEKFGPMFLNLEKAPADVWMLSSWYWVNSFDNYFHIPPPGAQKDKEFTWWPFQVSDTAGPSALRAGLYTEFVTEKQLMSDDIYKKRAIILPALLYCRQAVVDKLEDYIAKGGKVFVDEATKVQIKGATVMPGVDYSKWHFDIANGKRPISEPTEANYRKHRALQNSYTNAFIPIIKQTVGKVAQPAVTIDNTAGLYTLMANGEAKYLFIYNSNTDVAQTFKVTLKTLKGNIYDIAAGTKLNFFPFSRTFTVKLPAGGWRVYAVTPNQPSRVAVDDVQLNNAKLSLALRVLDGSGKLVNAAVPVKITLRGADGRSWTVYRATNRGELKLDLTCTGALPLPQAVEIEEMFSGESETVQITPVRS